MRGKRMKKMDWPIRQAIPVAALLLAIAALVAAAICLDSGRTARGPAEQEGAGVKILAEPETPAAPEAQAEGDIREIAAMYRAAEDPAEKQRLGESLEARGYFSPKVPMPWEYQDYLRTYCRLYGCPYPLALAVTEWETGGQFNMDASGPAREVGIFQLNPGPDGTYHAELEAATGLDPTTPEGNIAGGCYKLGKYLAEYKDVTMAAMAYNMGQAGAERARRAGISSTVYADAVLAAMERWGKTVDACGG